MSKKAYYVVKNTPTNLSLTFFGFCAFLMYYFKLDPLYIGILGTILFIMFCISVAEFFRQEKVDLGPLLEAMHELNKEPVNPRVEGIPKGNFAERLEKAMNEAIEKRKSEKK